MPDIDIDLANRSAALRELDCIPAMIMQAGKRTSHTSGVYFQDMPIDPLDGMAVWDYQTAEAKGYFKIDLLPKPFYNAVRDEAHLVDLMTREPPWHRLTDRAVVEQLEHLHNHFEVVQAIAPHSITDLAICLALIRPGKRHLLNSSRPEIERDIWLPVERYYFKRSHAIAYATAIVVQLNLLVEQGAVRRDASTLPEQVHVPP